MKNLANNYHLEVDYDKLTAAVIWTADVSSVLAIRQSHFTIFCSVTWPLKGSEHGGDLVLIQTTLPL